MASDWADWEQWLAEWHAERRTVHYDLDQHHGPEGMPPETRFKLEQIDSYRHVPWIDYTERLRRACRTSQDNESGTSSAGPAESPDPAPGSYATWLR